MSDAEIRFWLMVFGVITIAGSIIWVFLKSIYAGDLQEIKNDIYRGHETLKSIDKTLDSINDRLRNIDDNTGVLSRNQSLNREQWNF